MLGKIIEHMIDHFRYDHEVLEHDTYPEEVHSYAAKAIPNILDKDELTLA